MQAFCPDAELTTLQENVKEGRFDVAFIKTFSLVLNGLDNDEARRHVNRLCLAAEVPLVESGTTGYKGQARHHRADLPPLRSVGQHLTVPGRATTCTRCRPRREGRSCLRV